MKEMNRRKLLQLSLAALGGISLGRGGGSSSSTGKATQTASTSGEAGESLPRLLQDPHVCRGINTCKNKGKPGTMNECAGQGHCATVAAHDCNGLNECAGQGGCGERPGQNECKGKGACEVPLSEKTWPKARKKFEELMTSLGKKFGTAPERKG